VFIRDRSILQCVYWQLSHPGSRQELHDSPPSAISFFFPIRDKCRSIKTIKSTYLHFMRCWKWCPCTHTHTHALYRLNRLKFTVSSLRLLTTSRCRSLVQDVSVVSVVCFLTQTLFRPVFIRYARRVFIRFLVQKWPGRPDFINKFMDVCCAWNCDPWKLTTKFSPTLSSGTTLHIRIIQKNKLSNSISEHIHTYNNNQHLTRW
jgi:hypothetical protein